MDEGIKRMNDNLQTVTIKEDIPLPKGLRARWRNAEVLLSATDDTIMIKRVAPPAWGDLIPKLRKAGKSISKKVVDDAITWSRGR